MLNLLENAPASDPVAIPEQRAIIDQILEENRDLPGALMVILNEMQSKIGFISEPMQSYIAARAACTRKQGARRRFLLFLLYHDAPRPAHH